MERQFVSSTFHMKAVDVMRRRLLFETSQQPVGFDVRRPSAGVMCFISDPHTSPLPMSSSAEEKNLKSLTFPPLPIRHLRNALLKHPC